MCAADAGCGAGAACVAGRCLSRGGSPAIAVASRLLYDPVEAAYLHPGEETATAGLATLGRGDGALALFRFAVPLAADATVVEAYLVMERAADVDADPTPVLLHAAGVVSDWDSASVTWARQPAIRELGGSETRVSGAPRSFVRVEVKTLVERWRRRSRGEFGLAVLAEGKSATGFAFVLPARLELYVK
jgi:hypothetical protein